MQLKLDLERNRKIKEEKKNKEKLNIKLKNKFDFNFFTNRRLTRTKGFKFSKNEFREYVKYKRSYIKEDGREYSEDFKY